MTTFTGTSGNDSFAGTSAADIFNLQQGGDDTATGLGGTDLFNMGAAFDAADRIDGGDGSDTVDLDGDYSAGLSFNAKTLLNVEAILLAVGNSYKLTTNEATVAAGATLTVDGSALGAGDSLTFNGTKETDGSLILIGGAGNDVLSGGTYIGVSPVTNTFDLRQGGDDTVIGGFDVTNVANFGATFTAADRVQGHNMTIVLDGDYTGAHAVTMNATTMLVDTLKVSAGHSYTLVSGNNANSGNTLIDGSTLGAGDVLRFDGSAQAGIGVFDFIGGAGNDVLIGSSGGEMNLGGTFDLSKGGDDTVVGSPYSDFFEFGAAFTAADRVDGGTPDHIEAPNFGDTVELDGNYAGTHAVTFGAKTMVNIERLTVAAGHSYTLTPSVATVAAGQRLFVDGTALGAGNVLTFDGSAQKFGALGITGGAGNDVLAGGAQADGFDLSEGGNDTVHGGLGIDDFHLGGKLNAGDAIDGGAGTDFVTLDGDYSAGVAFSSTTLRHVEVLVLETGHSYKLTTADGTVSAGAAGLTVDALALVAGDDLNFDGSAETNGYFQVRLGAGKDTIRGGATDDLVDFGTDFKGNDFFNGGAGTDTVFVDKAYAASIVLSNLKNIEKLDLEDDNYHITTTDGVVSNGARLTVFIGGVNGETLWFDGSAETNGEFDISGEAPTITSGAAQRPITSTAATVRTSCAAAAAQTSCAAAAATTPTTTAPSAVPRAGTTIRSTASTPTAAICWCCTAIPSGTSMPRSRMDRFQMPRSTAILPRRSKPRISWRITRCCSRRTPGRTPARRS